MKGDLNQKLIRIERFIAIYRKNRQQAAVKEINIDIPLQKLKKIVHSKKDDPLLFEGYVLNSVQIEEINRLINNGIKVDFNKYNYILECSGVYDW